MVNVFFHKNNCLLYMYMYLITSLLLTCPHQICSSTIATCYLANITDNLPVILCFLVGSDLAGAFVLLHEAEMKLKRIVHDKFEAAIQNGDRGSVERY